MRLEGKGGDQRKGEERSEWNCSATSGKGRDCQVCAFPHCTVQIIMQNTATHHKCMPYTLLQMASVSITRGFSTSIK